MGAYDLGERPCPVEISNPFLLSRFPVTNSQFEEFAADQGVAKMDVRYRRLNSTFMGCNHPAVCVSYEDAINYISWLNDHYNNSESDQVFGKGQFDLPTEAQWEYAARAGRTEEDAQYATSTGILERSLALYAADSTCPVGQFPPNPWGLHDMTGLVWEWTNDWHREWPNYGVQFKKDPTGPESGEHKVIRGGSFMNDIPQFLRSAFQFDARSTARFKFLGMRVAFFPIKDRLGS